MSLYPTPARVGLLMDVRSNLVARSGGVDWLTWPAGRRRVVAAVDELASAGWVALHESSVVAGEGTWALTAAGAAVLDSHGPIR